MDDLERRFNGAMVSIYETAKRELGYNATRFAQMISDKAADRVFRRPSASCRGGGDGSGYSLDLCARLSAPPNLKERGPHPGITRLRRSDIARWTRNDGSAQ
jgi:hypothetical protein